ncbi:hypothetical protein D5272_06630 [bacterium D16-76]|nr:hypothetical protein [bacterium D16-76]
MNLYDENGKRKQKWLSTDLPLRGNKRNAEKFLRTLIDEWEAKNVPYSQLSLYDWLSPATVSASMTSSRDIVLFLPE